MTHLKRILLAIRALPVLAGRLVVNLLPVLAVVGFAAALGACGGKGANDDAKNAFAIMLPVGAVLLASRGDNDSGNTPATMTENPAPPPIMDSEATVRITVTTPAPPPVTVTNNPPPPAPIAVNLQSPVMGALYLEDENADGILAVVSVATSGENRYVLGNTFMVSRQSVHAITNTAVALSRIDRTLFDNTGQIAPSFVNGSITFVPAFSGVQVFVEGQPSISGVNALCPAPWLAAWIRANFAGNPCPVMSGMSYSPQMQRVVYAAMADGFNRGVGIGESPFAFSGRYDGDNRAAGFTYDWGGGYALRTDYIRLPSRQDSEVWLDTYRFGALSRINDEVQFFAGMDNYKNAIFVMDTNGNNGNNQHRLGFAYGDGYAVKYEYRLNL